MDGIHVRRANIDDYDEVIALRDGVYGGKDYIPALYKTMMDSHIGYVATCAGAIVAFESVIFADEGETMLPKVIRVQKEFEGRGLVRRIKEFIKEDHKHNSSIKRIAYSCVDQRLIKKIQDGQLDLTLKQDRLDFKGILNDMTRLVSPQCSPLVRTLQNKDLKELLCSNAETERLFPDGRIIVSWTPYRLLESNVDLFFTDACNVLGSGSSVQTSDRLELITIGCGYRATLGIIYNLEIFGDLGEELFTYHIEEHIRKCSIFPNDTIIFLMHFNGQFQDADFISKTMNKYATCYNKHPLYLYFVEEAFSLA